MAPRAIDTHAITQKFIAKEVEEKLAPLLDVLGVAASAIPVVGDAIAAATAFASAGLDEAASNTDTGLDIQPEDHFVHATNGELSLAWWQTWHVVLHLSNKQGLGC